MFCYFLCRDSCLACRVSYGVCRLLYCLPSVISCLTVLLWYSCGIFIATFVSLCAFVHFHGLRFQSFRRACCFGVCFVLYSSHGQMKLGVTKIQSIFYFKDIDECTTNIHSCDVKALSTNTEGSYECTCTDGFAKNGKLCIGNQTFFFC